MSKATENRNAQLDQLANVLALELATLELRMANYFTPYGFDPEPEDVARVTDLMEKYGDDFSRVVFNAASPVLMARVNEVSADITTKYQSLDALTSAGAQVTVSKEELFEQAVANSFRNSRAGAQAAANGVA